MKLQLDTQKQKDTINDAIARHRRAAATYRKKNMEARDAYALCDDAAKEVDNLVRSSIPFKKGDVVVDDMGVRYRVTEVYVHGLPSRYDTDFSGATSVDGIDIAIGGVLLAKDGSPRWKQSRPIVSNSLRLYVGGS